MQLTRAADYAIRVMVYLAGLPADRRISRAELAANTECPQQFLSKVLQNLIRAKLVISHRGNVGGFELPDEARDATLLRVIEAIEGPVRLNLCLISPKACHRLPVCPVHCVWRRAQDALTGVLDGITISQIAQNKCPIEAPDQNPWN